MIIGWPWCIKCNWCTPADNWIKNKKCVLSTKFDQEAKEDDMNMCTVLVVHKTPFCCCSTSSIINVNQTFIDLFTSHFNLSNGTRTNCYRLITLISLIILRFSFFCMFCRGSHVGKSTWTNTHGQIQMGKFDLYMIIYDMHISLEATTQIFRKKCSKNWKIKWLNDYTVRTNRCVL